MNDPLAVAAAILAWFGAALMVLSDARRGLAAGLVVLAAGLALERWVAGQPDLAAIISVGGLVAAALELRRNRAGGWGVLAAGSTPRVVLCIVVGALALYFGHAVILEPADWEGRAAILAVGLLAAGRLLTSDEERATLTAASAAALAVGLEAALKVPDAAPAAMVVGAVVAVVLSGLPSLGEVDSAA